MKPVRKAFEGEKRNDNGSSIRLVAYPTSDDVWLTLVAAAVAVCTDIEARSHEAYVSVTTR